MSSFEEELKQLISDIYDIDISVLKEKTSSNTLINEWFSKIIDSELNDYKQRVREVIDKLKTKSVECATGCFDDSKEYIIEVDELLKELGLDEEESSPNNNYANKKVE